MPAKTTPKKASAQKPAPEKKAKRLTLEEQIAAGGDPDLMLRRAAKSYGSAVHYSTGGGSKKLSPEQRARWAKQATRFQKILLQLRKERDARKAEAEKQQAA